ncbi:zinc finger protein 280D isoform X2 [Xenopus laevis]|uniref:Zinc finger protein 280D isoform X2 n=1 Tax=Xenopus laevis TaxID=8355 RepID=A0A8J0UR08_XENLA|nr:zinc finger protein 280D isoform X2 [Xenopus laevis]
MAELLMECEEEDLEPWQRRIKEVEDDEDDDDDELIFVREISGAKQPPAMNATPLVRPVQPLSQSLPVSVPTRTVPAAVHRPFPQMATVAKNLNLVTEPQQCLILNSQKTHQGISTQSSGASIGWNDNTVSEKRPAPIEISDDSPKKTKNAENECDNRLTDLSTSVKPPTLSQSSPTKVNAGTSSGTTPKHGPPFPRACPKCNIHFNLLEPMRKHMKFCCPDKVDHFFSGLANIEAMNAPGMIEDAEKGKLIMLVSDFYYGRYGGDLDLTQQEQKTHTFKCYSCHKVLKNNIRFMNHMKHHLELEKQSSESWENHTTCHHCYRQFPTPFQLQCHIESSHTLYESSTICKICELSFESEQILLQHMKDNHKPGEMPYVCQVCNYRSSAFAEVDSHFRCAHENTKSLLCPFCLKVIKSGTPYMQHYMKHQNKGVYRCAKCRLQFLTCKEKINHKTQHHRTFRKPRQLEGLPPGTKVTIRASVGSIMNSVPSPTNTVCTSPPSTAFQASPKVTDAKITQDLLVKSNEQNTKTKVSSPTPKKKPVSTTTTKRIKMINTALQNLRSVAGYYKCIECQLEVKDFEGHFHTYVHCSKCKFSTSCNKAYMNHMLSFHGRGSSKRAKASKKPLKDKRRITLVCLNCDFLTDVSGLDDMAKHLSESHNHSCQVVLENVSIFSSTLEGDMAKSRNESSVGERLKYCKIMLYDTKKIQSKGENNTVKTMEESGTSESSKISDVHRDFSSHDKHVTPVEPVKDSDQTTQDACNTNPIIGIAGTNSDHKDLMSTVEGEISNRDLTSETDQNIDSTYISDTLDESKASLEDVTLNIESQKPSFAGEENSFVQFLRGREEPESICSDVSEQSSVHLEPLTPSEILEHEATEILSSN